MRRLYAIERGARLDPACAVECAGGEEDAREGGGARDARPVVQRHGEEVREQEDRRRDGAREKDKRKEPLQAVHGGEDAERARWRGDVE